MPLVSSAYCFWGVVESRAASSSLPFLMWNWSKVPGQKVTSTGPRFQPFSLAGVRV